MKIKVNGQETPKNNYWYEKAYMDGEEKTIGMVQFFFENYFAKVILKICRIFASVFSPVRVLKILSRRQKGS